MMMFTGADGSLSQVFGAATFSGAYVWSGFSTASTFKRYVKKTRVCGSRSMKIPPPTSTSSMLHILGTLLIEPLAGGRLEPYLTYTFRMLIIIFLQFYCIDKGTTKSLFTNPSWA